MIETPKQGKPDRNEPDNRLAVGLICLVYGLPEPFSLLNGREAVILSVIDNFKDPIFPIGEVWFECAVRGHPTVMNLREDHLTVLTDSDVLVIEKLYLDK